MRILLDTNVALDLLLEREPFYRPAAELHELILAGSIQAIVCATTVTTIYYVAARHVGKTEALRLLRDFLATVEIASVDSATIEAALASPGLDFEDNVIAAAASAAGAEFIVTRDLAGFAESACPPVAPADFLGKYRGAK